MSVYYDFYIAKRNKNSHKVDLIGPYIKKGKEFKPSSILWRTSSCIEWDEFYSELIPMELMSSEVEELASIKAMNGDKYSVGNWVPLNTLSTINDMVIRGYAPLEDIANLVRTEYSSEYISYGMATPMPAEAYAEMSEEDRRKYGHTAYVEEYSEKYIGPILRAIAEDFVTSEDYDMDTEELGFLVTVG